MLQFRTCPNCVTMLARAQSNMRLIRRRLDMAGGGALTEQMVPWLWAFRNPQILLLLYLLCYPLLSLLMLIPLGNGARRVPTTSPLRLLATSDSSESNCDNSCVVVLVGGWAWVYGFELACGGYTGEW